MRGHRGTGHGTGKKFERELRKREWKLEKARRKEERQLIHQVEERQCS